MEGIKVETEILDISGGVILRIKYDGDYDALDKIRQFLIDSPQNIGNFIYTTTYFVKDAWHATKDNPYHVVSLSLFHRRPQGVWHSFVIRTNNKERKALKNFLTKVFFPELLELFSNIIHGEGSRMTFTTSPAPSLISNRLILKKLMRGINVEINGRKYELILKRASGMDVKDFVNIVFKTHQEKPLEFLSLLGRERFYLRVMNGKLGVISANKDKFVIDSIVYRNNRYRMPIVLEFSAYIVCLFDSSLSFIGAFLVNNPRTMRKINHFHSFNNTDCIGSNRTPSFTEESILMFMNEYHKSICILNSDSPANYEFTPKYIVKRYRNKNIPAEWYDTLDSGLNRFLSKFQLTLILHYMTDFFSKLSNEAPDLLDVIKIRGFS